MFKEQQGGMDGAEGWGEKEGSEVKEGIYRGHILLGLAVMVFLFRMRWEPLEGSEKRTDTS